MSLSFKDIKFILEAINLLLNQYNSRLEKIEDQEEYEDEASDLGNDSMFLESLKSEIEQNIDRGEKINLSVSSNTESPKKFNLQFI